VPGAGATVLQVPVSDTEYADDIMLIARSATQLQQLIDATHTYCQQLEMQVSAEKTKVVVFQRLLV
jgi:Reverse transcriptase (RNA-dependent DNA polymerase)